jgi:hypothetical protein
MRTYQSYFSFFIYIDVSKFKIMYVEIETLPVFEHGLLISSLKLLIMK